MTPMPALALADGAEIRVHPHFLSTREADALFDELRAGIRWRQEFIRIAGRRVAQPRLTAWYGDPDARYRYSGLALEPNPWIAPLSRIQQRLEGQGIGRFNSVLCNLYRDGSDSMGWHADDEPELGVDPVIASVSLGAPRRFSLRRAQREHRERRDLGLTHGSLLVMGGTTQHHYRHAVPKQRAPVGPRINLTFRSICA